VRSAILSGWRHWKVVMQNGAKADIWDFSRGGGWYARRR
jgi:hypothetical protein